MFHSQYKH